MGFRKCLFSKPKSLWRVKNLQEFSFRESYVYFLSLEEKVVYVGSTTSLGRRIRHHRKKIQFDSAYYITYTKIEDAREAELNFIGRIRPAHNKLGNFNYQMLKFRLSVPNNISLHEAGKLI